MDFLDPKKRRASEIRLIVGYVLVTIALMLGTVVLLYSAYGYGIKKGKIIQNGFVFVSSHPAGADIKIGDQLRGKTDSRLTLQADTYQMSISRTGYQTWARPITVEGDSVERFDYPFLFPTDLKTADVQNQTFSAAPAIATQSPSRRWLLIEPNGELGKFQLYDLSKPTTADTPTDVNLPSGVLTSPTTDASQKLTVIGWSDDNQHVLIEHFYDKTSEYILLDTTDPSQSVNLNKTLKTDPTQLTLENKKYNQFFVYSAANQVLSTASLSSPTLVPMVQHVLSFNTYGTNVALYTTSQNASAGQVEVRLFQNNHDYFIRDIPKSSTYLLDLTQYSGSWYVAAGSATGGQVFVYQNPLDSLTAVPGNNDSVLVPVAVLKVKGVNYLSFSASAQFIMAENGSSFSVYDVQYQNTYNYTMHAPKSTTPLSLDQPQVSATWMDGDRLTYTSGGKLVVFDYDGTNFQTLMAASPAYEPFFDQIYKYVYALAPAPTATNPATTALTYIALLTPADL